MKSILKNLFSNGIVTSPHKPYDKTKSVNELIEEIHESFYTEVDKLLASAKLVNSLDTNKQVLIDKCRRLEALGFTNTKEVQEARIEIQRLNLLKEENRKKNELTDAINYFSFKYPNYKFITEESVKKICEKYNLIYGSTDRYIGTVPDKNLKHIEDFKISEDDECYVLFERYWGLKEGVYYDKSYQHWFERSSLVKLPLEIVAPISDFNLEESEIKDFKISKIEVPDPIVLKPVVYNNKKYYLIVTAWGIEASDEMVVNPKHN